MTRTSALGMASVLMLSSSLVPAAAVAQDVVMRRPIPTLSDPGASTPADPTDPSGSGPDAPGPGPAVPPNPATAVCDATTSSSISAVSWVERGWEPAGAGMCGERMRYACVATYSCDVGGRATEFSSEAPDSTCEDHQGDVSYPEGERLRQDDGSTSTAAVASLFRASGAIARQRASTTIAIPGGAQDVGLESFDYRGAGSPWGFDQSGIARSYVARVNDYAMCQEINRQIGVQGMPEYNVGSPAEACGLYRGDSTWYWRRVDGAQAPQQARFLRSYGADARTGTASLSYVPGDVGQIGLAGRPAANLLGGRIGFQDASGRRVVYAEVNSPAACLAVDGAANPGRSTGYPAGYDPDRLDEGCGGFNGALYYWRRIDDVYAPRFASALRSISAGAMQAAAGAGGEYAGGGAAGGYTAQAIRDWGFIDRSGVYDDGGRRFIMILFHSYATCAAADAQAGNAGRPLTYAPSSVREGCGDYGGNNFWYWRRLG